MTWVLSQSGPSVSGTVTAATPEAGVVASGSLSGTLSGSTLQFSIAVPAGNVAGNPGCAVSITGIGDVTASRISALYSGIASCAGVFNGEFALNKE